MVTAIDSAYIHRIKELIIAVGSKDCRVTLWRFDPVSRKIVDHKQDLSEILYGHHDEITSLCIEKTLGIIVSCDKDGVILLFCIASRKLLKSIYPDFYNDEYAKICKADENGFIIIITNKERIFVYT